MVPFAFLHGPQPSTNLDDVPDILCRVTELAASHTGRQAVVADRDRVILELVGKVVASFGHGADEDADALLRTQIGNVVSHPHNRSIEG